jgi:hypothetical protein
MRTYDEVLSPPWTLWAGVWLGSAVLGLTVFVALGPLAGLAALLVPGVALSVVLRSSAAPVQVDGADLVAGRARIPAAMLGPVEVLDAEAARRVRGPESDPAAYHLIRGWVSGGVRAPVRDEGDPTPYWFVASRHPAALAEAIEAAKAVRT